MRCKVWKQHKYPEALILKYERLEDKHDLKGGKIRVMMIGEGDEINGIVCVQRS